MRFRPAPRWLLDHGQGACSRQRFRQPWFQLCRLHEQQLVVFMLFQRTCFHTFARLLALTHSDSLVIGFILSSAAPCPCHVVLRSAPDCSNCSANFNLSKQHFRRSVCGRRWTHGRHMTKHVLNKFDATNQCVCVTTLVLHRFRKWKISAFRFRQSVEALLTNSFPRCQVVSLRKVHTKLISTFAVQRFVSLQLL